LCFENERKRLDVPFMRMADPTESLPDAHEQFFSKGDTTDDVGIDHVHREYHIA